MLEEAQYCQKGLNKTKYRKPSEQPERDQIHCSLNMPMQCAFEFHTGSET